MKLRFALDCGMFAGQLRSGERRRDRTAMYERAEVPAIVKGLLGMPVLFQLAVESRLTDAEELRCHQLIAV